MKFAKITGSFHVYAIASIICWSLAFPLTRIALRHFTAPSLSFLRYLATSVFLLVFAATKKVTPPKRKDWLWFIVCGASGFALYVVLFNTGTRYVSAATSSVLIATAPVLTAFLAYVFYGEKLKWYQWLACAIELAGIAALNMSGGVFTVNIGVLWLLAAVVCFSIYNVLQRQHAGEYTPIQKTVYSVFAATLMLSVFAPGAVFELPGAGSANILILLLLGVFPGAIGYITWVIAIEKADKISYASNYMFFTPFLASAQGVLFVGEPLDGSTLLGGLIIIAGSMLFNKQNLLPIRKNSQE